MRTARVTKSVAGLVEAYTYRVQWSEEDQEHIGLCAELPMLSHLDRDAVKAFRGIRELVASVVADRSARNLQSPAPLSKRRFSGVFKVRLPPDVHRNLAREAAEQGVSLNRLVSAKLAG